ncbi:MAG: O-acetylserine/cysteine efflux transporter [Chloroflexota bacterium]|nr:O-acetylserine/cysteine efflux transporter [Chloroflexota bacterium]
MRPRDIVLLVAIAVMWGFNFVPIRWALDAVPPFALAAVRFFFAAVPLVFFVRRPAAPVRLVVAYGLLIGVGQFGLLFLAISLGMSAGLTSLLAQLQVFFTIGLAAWFLGDRASLAQVVGAGVAGMGIALLIWERFEGGAVAPVLPLLMVVAAAALWGVANVLARHVGRTYQVDGFSLVVWSSLASPLPLALMSFFTEGGTAPIGQLLNAGWLAWASIVFIVIAATLWGFATWNQMLRRYTAAAVTPFALLVPFAGIGSAALLLGERFTVLELLAGLTILAGLAVAVWPRRRPAPPAVPASTI